MKSPESKKIDKSGNYLGGRKNLENFRSIQIVVNIEFPLHFHYKCNNIIIFSPSFHLMINQTPKVLMWGFFFFYVSTYSISVGKYRLRSAINVIFDKFLCYF